MITCSQPKTQSKSTLYNILVSRTTNSKAQGFESSWQGQERALKATTVAAEEPNRIILEMENELSLASNASKKDTFQEIAQTKVKKVNLYLHSIESKGKIFKKMNKLICPRQKV